VESYAPNFRASIVGHSASRTLDLEEKPGLIGGDIFFHGESVIDRVLAARPMLGCGDRRTPVKNLYLCGFARIPAVARREFPVTTRREKFRAKA
jgi:phytoene dehydrogenase-like protein